MGPALAPAVLDLQPGPDIHCSCCATEGRSCSRLLQVIATLKLSPFLFLSVVLCSVVLATSSHAVQTFCVCREVRALIKLLTHLTIRDVVDFGGSEGQVNVTQVSQFPLCQSYLTFGAHPQICICMESAL